MIGDNFNADIIGLSMYGSNLLYFHKTKEDHLDGVLKLMIY